MAFKAAPLVVAQPAALGMAATKRCHGCQAPDHPTKPTAIRRPPPKLVVAIPNLRCISGRYATKSALSRKLPEGKVLIPGVIEFKSNIIEHPELIAQRIARYANLVGRESSDCGYGTWVGQAAVDPDVVWAKFAAMAEGARIASRQFWEVGLRTGSLIGGTLQKCSSVVA